MNQGHPRSAFIHTEGMAVPSPTRCHDHQHLSVEGSLTRTSDKLVRRRSLRRLSMDPIDALDVLFRIKQCLFVQENAESFHSIFIDPVCLTEHHDAVPLEIVRPDCCHSRIDHY